MPCRVNRRRVWTGRLLLELECHEESVFLTLTYTDENLITTKDGLPTLFPRHLTLFLKKLRKKYGERKIRYYAVGEYGDNTERPHYHLALFGAPQCERGNTRILRSGQKCCDVCSSYADLWAHGAIFAGDLSRESASYVCGYVTKKLTSESDTRLKGRHPEFSRMSKRPGIGAWMTDEIASELMARDRHLTLDDVPEAVRMDGRKWPLGRYLRQQLRKKVGFDEKAPQATLDKMAEEMRPMYENSYDPELGYYSPKKYKEEITLNTKVKRRQLEAKNKRYNGKRHL